MMAARRVRIVRVEDESGVRDERHLCDDCLTSVDDFLRVLGKRLGGTSCDRCDYREPETGRKRLRPKGVRAMAGKATSGPGRAKGPEPWVGNYPALQQWLDKHGARCMTQHRTGGTAAKPTQYTEVWLFKGGRMAIIVVHSKGTGWDIYTASNDQSVIGTLRDVEARLCLNGPECVACAGEDAHHVCDVKRNPGSDENLAARGGQPA